MKINIPRKIKKKIKLQIGNKRFKSFIINTKDVIGHSDIKIITDGISYNTGFIEVLDNKRFKRSTLINATTHF